MRSSTVSCGDQPVDEHRPVLADAVGAVGGLGLDRRVPPGVAQEHVIGRGQVQAHAARLERDQHHRRSALALEAVDHLAAIPGAAVQAHELQPGGAAGAARSGRAATSTARTPAPCAPRRRPAPAPRPAAPASTSCRRPPRHPRRAAAPGGRRPGAAAAAPPAPSSRRPPAAAAPPPRRASPRGRRRRRRARARRARWAAPPRCAAAARAPPPASAGAARTGGSSAAAPRPIPRTPSAMGRAKRSSKLRRPPSRPRLLKWIRLHSSSRRFSIGVPVRHSRPSAGRA